MPDCSVCAPTCDDGSLNPFYPDCAGTTGDPGISGSSGGTGLFFTSLLTDAQKAFNAYESSNSNLAFAQGRLLGAGQPFVSYGAYTNPVPNAAGASSLTAFLPLILIVVVIALFMR